MLFNLNRAHASFLKELNTLRLKRCEESKSVDPEFSMEDFTKLVLFVVNDCDHKMRVTENGDVYVLPSLYVFEEFPEEILDNKLVPFSSAFRGDETHASCAQKEYPDDVGVAFMIMFGKALGYHVEYGTQILGVTSASFIGMYEDYRRHIDNTIPEFSIAIAERDLNDEVKDHISRWMKFTNDTYMTLECEKCKTKTISVFNGMCLNCPWGPHPYHNVGCGEWGEIQPKHKKVC